MLTPFRLNKPIGEEFNMDLDDSLNTKKTLADLGHMKVPERGLTEFPDRPMLDGVKSFQREQNLQVDGVMKPDGPTLKRLNEILVAGQKQTRPPGPFIVDPKPAPPRLQVKPIDLKHPITPGTNVDLRDTSQVKKALHDLGLLDTRSHGLNEFPDEPMFEGIKAFQRQQRLKVDGEVQLEGETIEKLNNVIKKQSKVESPPKNDHDQVELAFAPAVPIGIAFAEWLMGVLPAATVAAAMAVFAASSKPRQQELRKQYQGETGKNDDEDDACYRRWETEDARCGRRAPMWQDGCRKRAEYRRRLCIRNGGIPDPEEPPEWSKADEEIWKNPHR